MTGRVGRWTGVKKEVVIMLYVLSQTIGCYAANQLPSSDVQQNGMGSPTKEGESPVSEAEGTVVHRVPAGTWNPQGR